MNYGETLAHWYLRLNGFFPLRDFVLHRGEDSSHTRDCDLLALRFPHVFEEVGGQASDWDRARFEGWGLNLERPLVLVVQVKTGREGTDDGAFNRPFLLQALRRTGLWTSQAAEICATALEGAATHETEEAQVAKLLVASQPCVQGNRYRVLALSQALAFIQARFQTYREVKQADRLFFPDDLIQFLASSEAESLGARP
jgi:hypothetical protein